MQFTGRYAAGIYLGVAGLGTMAAISFMSLPQDFKQAMEQTNIERSAALERTKLQQESHLEQERALLKRQRADSYANNEVLDTSSFSIWGYTDNPTVPPKLDYRAFDADSNYKIFDGTGKCIGWVISKTFYWRHSKGNADICNREF